MALNVLVVDDSAVMRSIIIKTLRMSGILLGDVFQAGNGEEGLRILDSNWIDLTLLDIHMPVMDGEQMIRQLRQRPETKDMPVLVVTSESNQNRIDLLSQQGAIYVRKPFTPESLRESIIKITGVSNE